MVVFNCNACGEPLKKNQVEKHYQSVCRRCEVVSCVDCGKDFWGDDYKQHTKCISEEEKYSGKNYKPKPNANKGEAKQEAWLKKVQEAIDKANPQPRLKDLLEKMKEYPNIPRKKAKFENFLSNSLRVYDRSLSSKVWDMLMTTVAQDNDGAVNTNNNSDNGASDPKQAEKPETNQHENTAHSPVDSNSNGNDLVSGGEALSKLSKRERKEERRKKANKSEKKDAHKCTQDDSAENSKQKKKKRRREEGETEKCVQDSCSIAESQTASAPKKSKKKRKREADDKENSDEASTQEKTSTDKGDDSGVLDVSRSSEATENEDEPTSKKRKTKVHFDLENVIFAVLRSRSDKEISIKKLKKKVVAEYFAQGGFAESEEKLWAKFVKKVKRNASFKVLKDKVTLVE